MMSCSVCGEKVHAKGMCQKHYRRELLVRQGGELSPWLDLSDAEKLAARSVKMENGCVLWTGAIQDNGYGQMYSKLGTLTHRISYRIHKGEIPEGMVVCHRCDTPACINPDHLFVGTPTDNNQDRDSKGRGCNGERHHSSKLSEDDVRYIRASTEFLKTLAEKFHTSMTTISEIRLRKTWKHLP